MLQERALLSGCPNIRIVVTPRTGTGVERLALYYSQVMPALTNPLTATEMSTGVYTPPPAPRIAFRGTLDQAQDYFQREQLFMCGIPMTQWTDGSPIIIPTEAKVAAMLTGTSHAPTELVGRITATQKVATTPTSMQPMGWTATVEKVAINAVMAGCKPKHLPAVLAEALSGVGTGTTTMWSQWQVVSGPWALESGMNYDIGVWDGQNIANMCIGRAYELMAINLGGAQVGTNRMNSLGSPFNHGAAFAENGPNIPAAWVGMNVDLGFKATDSVIAVFNTAGGFAGDHFSPSSYRGFQGQGQGGIALRLGVSGPPPAGTAYNFLEYYVPPWAPGYGLWDYNMDSFALMMVPEMAQNLVDAGFPTKQSVSTWLYNHSMMPIGDLKKMGWWDFDTNGGRNIEPTTGIAYGLLPDTTIVPAQTSGPTGNLILVVGGAEEICYFITSHGSTRQGGYNIDLWR